MIRQEWIKNATVAAWVSFGITVGAASAYTPILTTNDNLVRWHLDEPVEDQPNIIERSVEFFINRQGTPDIDDDGEGVGGEFEILRESFRTWEAIPTSVIDFNDLKLTDQVLVSSRDETNLIVFDENNSTGLFPSGSGIIAITLLTYDDEEYEGRFDGRVRDADLIFNGADFVFGDKGEPDRIDLQSVATHEIGHIIGLGHSFLQHTSTDGTGLTTPTMYPYLYYGDRQARTLETDDIAGTIELYPFDELNDRLNGSISGRVTRAAGKAGDPGEVLYGVDIVAYENGVPIVSTISRKNGVYRMFGVPAGTYVLRALQVSPQNLSLPEEVDTDFLSEYYPAAGSTNDASPITVIPGRRRFSFDFDLPLGSSADFFEPDDSAAEAGSIRPDGERRIHQFYREGDEDWIRFEAQGGVSYEVVTDNLAFFANPFLEIFGSDGVTLIASGDNLGPDSGNYAARVAFTAQESGTYFIRLTDERGSYGAGTSFEVFVTRTGVSSRFDTNGDGVVDTKDLFLLARRWHRNPWTGKGFSMDLNGETLLQVIQVLQEGIP